MTTNDRIEPPESFRGQARVRSRDEYAALHRESLVDPEGFWARELEGVLSGWHTLREGELPHVQWFVGRRSTSASGASIATSRPRAGRTALIWEGEPEAGGAEVRTRTYAELHAEVVAFAGALAALGVGEGDRVVIYMGMVPEAVVAMLACARLGAVHSVVFGGFAAEALASRISTAGRSW
jgi:acetyl-CoA synthetase